MPPSRYTTPRLTFRESEVEVVALNILEELGYTYAYGPNLEPEGEAQERDTLQEVLLPGRVRAALARLNPQLPPEALEEAYRRVSVPQSPSLIANNRAFHRMLVEGVPVEYVREGRVIGDFARLIDFDQPDKNDWLAVNQYSLVEGRYARRADIVVLINGLPLVILELKNAADEKASIDTAYKQLQTYKDQLTQFFVFNELMVISDGLNARIGTLTSDRERYMPWRLVDEGEGAAHHVPMQYREMGKQEVLLRGVFERTRLLDLLRHFIVFEDDGERVIKKLAGYHQFHAVRRAVQQTVRATRPEGDQRVGVIWHTQGSGKSLTMAFYAGKVILDAAMQNPTLVVITDRNDLDDQLFGTFSRCRDLLRQTPVQAEDRDHLRDLLSKSASGGVIFTTIQKFAPVLEGKSVVPARAETQASPNTTRTAEALDSRLRGNDGLGARGDDGRGGQGRDGGEGGALSTRHNIVVIADEAHRSQYGFGAKTRETKDGIEIAYGFAKYLRDALPNAAFIGFTGTPVEQSDRNTRAVFGEHISIYDIQKAVEDKATVPILYESRLVKLNLKDDLRPWLDEQFEEVTEGEEQETREQLKGKWAALEALVGEDKRIRQIAQDILQHFELRRGAMEGKGMIVCMSRRICVALYNALIELKPEWGSDDDAQGALKVIMTGSASDTEWQPHIRNKARREALAKRFKNPSDPFRLVIVRDMWLTGFDAPCLHTMYLDKPMQGHGLMQAIARVNRVFKDKPGGLVVDYLGLAESLRQAMRAYTDNGGQGDTHELIEQAVAVLMEKYEICRGILYGFDWLDWLSGTPQDRLNLLVQATDHVLQQYDGKARWLAVVSDLSKAFALCNTHEKAIEIRDDVGFFQAVRAAVAKLEGEDEERDNGNGSALRRAENLDHAIRQIVSQAIAPGEVVDIFAAAGLNKPDLSILSEEFLNDIRQMPQRNLAVEMLRKLLSDEIKQRGRSNIVQARSFSEMLAQAIQRYQNRAIDNLQMMEELVGMAKAMREAKQRGEQLNLTPAEEAFYDALGNNVSAKQAMGDAKLVMIAREVTKTVRDNTSIDWTVKDSVRSKLRVMVKRVLRKYGYPPDLQDAATQLVLAQAEQIAAEWVGAG